MSRSTHSSEGRGLEGDQTQRLPAAPARSALFADERTAPLHEADASGQPRPLSATLRLFAAAATVGIIAGLYFGQALLIPVVLSCLLSFLLVPLVTRLQRWGLGNIPAVLFAVGIASAVLTTVIAIVTFQVIDLADSLPAYQSNIEKKLEVLRDSVGRPVNRLREMSEALDHPENAPPGPPTPSEPGEPESEPPVVAPAPPEARPLTPMGVLSYVVGTTIGPLASAAIVFVLVLFMLIERKELRARLIRLLGARPGELYVSTQALDDASTRVSRYLLMQLVVNVTYGVPIGVGLYFIGVPGAFLWGLLAIVLRFIPYIGPIVAGAFPLALAIAVDPGWSLALWTLGYFVVVEIISNNFVEPVLYGNSTGISPLGIILSAVFWAWLWGPIGLLMATPLTACLVVLGHHIPAMHIFPLLLGDQPVLSLHSRIFQRLLAMDLDEPDELTQKFLAEKPVEVYYDEVLVPLLCLLEEEHHYHALDMSHRDYVLERVRDLVEDAAEHPGPTKKPENGQAPPSSETDPAQPPVEPDEVATSLEDSAPRGMILNVPADDAADEIVARMLTIILQKRGVPAATLRAGVPAGGQVEESDVARVRVVCISALPPLAPIRARHRVARARVRAPEAQVVLGLWRLQSTGTELRQRLGPARDVPIATTLVDAAALTLKLLKSEPVVKDSPRTTR